MTIQPEAKRKARLIEGLAIDKPGLEVSPLFRPTVLKSQCNVFYTDYTTAEHSREKHSNYVHDEIMDIDFVWTPGKRLIDCVPDKKRFDWAIASHVLEHVPDPIGWLLEIFDVLNPGAVISLALPEKQHCFDAFRRETDAADLVDVWVRRQKIPSPRQLFDFLSRALDGSKPMKGSPTGALAPFEEQVRVYTDENAMDFVAHSWVTGAYFDAHCSVFTPESFVSVMKQLNAVGILNVTVSEPVSEFGEFIVKLTKVGDPRRSHPGSADPVASGFVDASWGGQSMEQHLAEVAHYRVAYSDAVKVQETLKADLLASQRKLARVPVWMQSLAAAFSR